MAVFICVISTFMLLTGISMLGFTAMSSFYAIALIVGALVSFFIALIINDTDK